MPTNRAFMKVYNRESALQAYMTKGNILIPPGNRMSQLTARFSSFATTVQTRMNSSGATSSALGGTLEAQVDRALSQALRQPAGVSTAAGPISPDASISALVGGVGGSPAAMSPFQASMLREARITQADVLSVLGTLQPLSPFTDPGDVASVQALVAAEVSGLLEEFSYARLLPRQQRVRVFLGGLLGWDYDNSNVTSVFANKAQASDIQTLVALLNLGGPLIPTTLIEDQLSSQQVVASDGVLFDTQWNTFWTNAVLGVPTNPVTWALWEQGVNIWSGPGVPYGVAGGLGRLAPQPQGPPSLISLGPAGPQLALQAPWRLGVINAPQQTAGQSFTERMIQADLLLPVIAQDAMRVADSMAAVGFTAAEQEASFMTLWSAVDADLLGVSLTTPVAPPANWSTILGGYLISAQTLGSPPAPPGTTPPPGATAIASPIPIPVYMTVADILDWAENLASQRSLDLVRNAGALGLNLLCDQADELFWLALAMLDQAASAQISALADTVVQLVVASLATDLNTFANLAY